MDEYQLKNFLKFAPGRLGITQKKHLLVHIPKNAGIAIREAPALKDKIVIAHRRRLVSKRYASDLLAFKQTHGLHPGYEHARFRDIDHSVRAGTVPFTIVRNPWARTFSRYKFYLQTGGGDLPRRSLSIEGFEEFLETRHEFGSKPFFWHRASLGWYPQTDYVIDEAGVLRVNALRQENLGEEVARYFGIDERLERKNVSRDADASYQNFYTENTIQGDRRLVCIRSRDVRLRLRHACATRNRFFGKHLIKSRSGSRCFGARSVFVSGLRRWEESKLVC